MSSIFTKKKLVGLFVGSVTTAVLILSSVGSQPAMLAFPECQGYGWDYFELYIYHNEGASQNTDTTYYPTLAVIEQL